nr:hypothetical protein [Acidiferrobacter sp. SPIII_3]
MHTDPEVLGSENARGKVSVARYEQSIRDNPALREANHVRNDKTVNGLLLAHTVERAQPQLEVIKLLNSLMLSGLPVCPVGAIIPIDSEETGFREGVFCFLEERVSEYGIIERDGLSAHLLTLRYLNGLHPKIAGIHENGDPPHKRP